MVSLPSGNNKTPSITGYSLREAERVAVIRALEAHKDETLTAIARHLGVTRHTLQRLIRIHNLDEYIKVNWAKAYTWILKADASKRDWAEKSKNKAKV